MGMRRSKFGFVKRRVRVVRCAPSVSSRQPSRACAWCGIVTITKHSAMHGNDNTLRYLKRTMRDVQGSRVRLPKAQALARPRSRTRCRRPAGTHRCSKLVVRINCRPANRAIWLLAQTLVSNFPPNHPNYAPPTQWSGGNSAFVNMHSHIPLDFI